MLFKGNSSTKFDDVKKWKENFVSELRRSKTTRSFCFSSSGFLEGEMKKDEIPIEELQGPVEAPSPRQMIDLEVNPSSLRTERSFFGLGHSRSIGSSIKRDQHQRRCSSAQFQRIDRTETQPVHDTSILSRRKSLHSLLQFLSN